MNTVKQQVYTIHQHHLSRDGELALECAGWGSDNPEVRAYSAKSDGSKAFCADHWEYYKEAMKVTANGLEQVFSAGNGYGEFADQVEKLGPSYSCSVGDIIQCGGLYWMVEPCGFSEITDTVKNYRRDL